MSTMLYGSRAIDAPDVPSARCADCGCEIDYADYCDRCHDLQTLFGSCPVEPEPCPCCLGRGLVGSDCECPRCHGTGETAGVCPHMEDAERAQLHRAMFDYEPETAVAA